LWAGLLFFSRYQRQILADSSRLSVCERTSHRIRLIAFGRLFTARQAQLPLTKALSAARVRVVAIDSSSGPGPQVHCGIRYLLWTLW
jgi:hypothetical protein